MNPNSYFNPQNGSKMSRLEMIGQKNRWYGKIEKKREIGKKRRDKIEKRQEKDECS